MLSASWISREEGVKLPVLREWKTKGSSTAWPVGWGRGQKGGRGEGGRRGGREGVKTVKMSTSEQRVHTLT